PHRLGGSIKPDTAFPVHFCTEDMAHDLVTVASTTTRAFLEFGRNPGAHAIEVRPGGFHESQLPIQFLDGHLLIIEIRMAKRNTPKVGRTGSDYLIHNLMARQTGELGFKPGKSCDRLVPWNVGQEKIQRARF